MAFERRLEPEQWKGSGLSRHVSVVARAAPPGRPARAGAARAGDRAGRLGRADARQRPRLRHPGAGAVEDRGGDRAARSDHREPRAGDGARGGAAARAHHAAARRRGGQATAGLPYYAGPPVRPRPPAGPPSKFVPEIAAAAAGDAAHLRPLQAHAARQPDAGTGEPEVVQFTATRRRRPQGRRQDGGQPRGRGRGDPQDARRRPPPIASCARCRCTRATASTSAC